MFTAGAMVTPVLAMSHEYATSSIGNTTMPTDNMTMSWIIPLICLRMQQ
jgi:hypothetical protein